MEPFTSFPETITALSIAATMAAAPLPFGARLFQFRRKPRLVGVHFATAIRYGG
jgi:hypothetical protein